MWGKNNRPSPSSAKAVSKETRAAVYTGVRVGVGVGVKGTTTPLTTERTCSSFSEDTKDSPLPRVAA